MAEGEKKKKTFISLFIRLFIGAGALFLVFRGEDMGNLWQLLTAVNPLLLLLALLLFWLAQVVFVLRWRIILSVQDVKLGITDAYKLHLMCLFYNNCLPSAVGGDFLRAWYVTRHAPAGKRVEAALSVFIDRFVGLSGMIIMALAAWLLVPVPAAMHSTPHTEKATNPVIGFIIGFWWLWVVIFLAGLLFIGACLLFAPTRCLLFRLFDRFWTLLRKLIGKTLAASHLYLRKPLTVILAYILTFICQAIPIFGFYLLGRDMGMPAHIKYYFVFFPVSWMIGAVPISIGGIGFMEGWLKFAFADLPGVTSAQAAAIAIYQRLVWLIGSLPGVLVHVFGGHLPAQKRDFFVDGAQSQT